MAVSIFILVQVSFLETFTYESIHKHVLNSDSLSNYDSLSTNSSAAVIQMKNSVDEMKEEVRKVWDVVERDRMDRRMEGLEIHAEMTRNRQETAELQDKMKQISDQVGRIESLLESVFKRT